MIQQNLRSILVLSGLALSGLLVFFLGTRYADIIGFLAAISTTISFIPQVVQTLRTRDTSGISLNMYILFVFGISCWLSYGIHINDLPMICANIVTLMLALSILWMKLHEK